MGWNGGRMSLKEIPSSTCRDLQIQSARSQSDCAVIQAKKEGEHVAKVIMACLPTVIAQIEERPELQGRFAELLNEAVANFTEGKMEAGAREKLLHKVAKVGNVAKAYNITVRAPATPFAKVAPEHFSVYDRGAPMPRVVLHFDPKAKHTIPLEDYLRVRMSPTIQQFIAQGTSIDVFVGPSRDIEHYYHLNGKYKVVAHLNTKSSITYLLFEDKKGRKKVVVTGISNESKLTHTLLQLKAAGVPLEHISVRGDINTCIRALGERLEGAVNKHVAGKPIALAVMGNRSGMVLEVAERLYPEEMRGPFATEDEREKQAVALLTEHNDYKETNIDGIFKLSSVEVDTKEGRKVLISFRMPNGDLSRLATRLVLQQNQVDGFVMVGAGGSLRRDSAVGNYQVTTKAHLDGEEVELPTEHIMPLEFRSREFCQLGNSNMTVLSPLVETEQWLTEAREGFQNVDVETYFIMEALAEAMKTDDFATKIFPGLFISDVVEDHPLVEKIDPKNAWPHLPILLDQSLTHAKVEDRRKPSIEVVEDREDQAAALLEEVQQTDVGTQTNESSWSWGTIAKIGLAAAGAIALGVGLYNRFKR